MNTKPYQRMASCLRVLSAEMVEQANSGHPGAPLGMAEMAVVLWARHLKHNPADPSWADRDRFVLSNGHASALLYSLLHLTGYALSADDLGKFRQLGSKTPGHPEVGITPGVETTTGPLGQGLANAVGMALAEQQLAAQFNRPGHSLVHHRTWVFVGDGCLMEGISQEAISLAGTLKLAKLTVLYDDNGISIDGAVQNWFSEDTPARFRACGWHVIGPINGHSLVELDAALLEARLQTQPTLVICKTEIGHGAPMAGTADVHGSPLGKQGMDTLLENLDWPDAPCRTGFDVPQDLRQAWDAREGGQALQKSWAQTLASYAATYPELADEFVRRMQGDLPSSFTQSWPAIAQQLAQDAEHSGKSLATRKASQNTLDAIAGLLPELLGGSADLTGSNLTDFKNHTKLTPHARGNYLSYGVREFGMAAIMNGLALHGGVLPFGGTFLTFSDYSRNAIRMAALMRQRLVHVFTHDSIGLGEDGPTHQAVEHVASLRLIPQLDVWRPCDALETAVAWCAAVQRRDGPSALILSRQGLPTAARPEQLPDVERGGYILRDMPQARALIIATGSEVQLALAAQQRLAQSGLATRVVSMPCVEVFERQSVDWQQHVLSHRLPAVAVEAGHPDGWRKFVGRAGVVIGIKTFGESAPGPEVMKHFGFTQEAVAQGVRIVYERHQMACGGAK